MVSSSVMGERKEIKGLFKQKPCSLVEVVIQMRYMSNGIPVIRSVRRR